MKIGIFAGEIPPPHFIHQLVSNIAGVDHQVFLYGSLKENFFSYYNQYIIIRIKHGNRVRVFITAIFLIMKLIYKYGNWSVCLLSQIWKHDRKISIFIKRCSIVLPPFLDELDIFHIQWAKTIVHYPEFIDKLKCPVLLSLRGAHINYSPLADIQLSRGYKKYFPKVKGFHAVSESIAKEAGKYGADYDKVTVIHPAVNRDLIKQFSLEESYDIEKIFNIISVGRCHWKKGYTIALDSMNMLKKDGIRFHYTIVANGKDFENLIYQINDLGLDESVSFINGLRHEDVLKKLARSDLFLLPSVEEGISNAVLEAMALSVPVISTDCGGMTEVIINGENGFIVPVREPRIMADEIKKIIRISNPRKKTIINNADLTIKQNFLLEQQIEKMKQFYSIYY